MSRLWPSVHIALTPGHVAVANGKASRQSDVDSPGWPGALKTLSALLAGGVWRGRADVTLSHHFAHMHCLPPPPVLLKPSEMPAWIYDYLEHQYGEAGMDWKLAWQSEAPGKPFLAGSIAGTLLAELEETLRGAALKPVSVQPWFAIAWNRNYRRFGKGQAWYALVEPGRMMLASLGGGEIRSLRTTPIQGNPAAPLADLVKREALLAGIAADAPVWIDSVLMRADWRDPGGGLNTRVLPTAGESLAAMLGN